MFDRFLVISCFAVLSVLISACNHPKEKPDEDSDTENVYEASLVKREHVNTALTLPGELEGFYETGIVAKVNGYIKRMPVDIGDHVRAGELLAELDAPEIISQLAGAYSEFQAKEAIFLNTKGRLTRLLQTNKTPGAVSPYDVDLARTTLTSDSLGFIGARAKYESIKELSNYLRITAPFNGVITERALAPGAFVGPSDKQGTIILKLKSEDKLRLHLGVPEKNLGEIGIGDLVKFKVKSFPDEIFEGRISRLAKNLNVQTRSEIVEVEIDNKTGKLLPGMYAVATIPLQRQETSFVVPSAGVVTNMERSFVIKINNGNQIKYVDVDKGEQSNGRVEIFGKLHAGDTVLNSATDELKEGSKVKIVLVENVIAEK